MCSIHLELYRVVTALARSVVERIAWEPAIPVTARAQRSNLDAGEQTCRRGRCSIATKGLALMTWESLLLISLDCMAKPLGESRRTAALAAIGCEVYWCD